MAYCDEYCMTIINYGKLYELTEDKKIRKFFALLFLSAIEIKENKIKK